MHAFALKQLLYITNIRLICKALLFSPLHSTSFNNLICKLKVVICVCCPFQYFCSFHSIDNLSYTQLVFCFVFQYYYLMANSSRVNSKRKFKTLVIITIQFIGLIKYTLLLSLLFYFIFFCLKFKSSEKLWQ